VAERARDPETAQLAQRILAEERTAAEKLKGLFGQALDASLRDQRLPAR
jgi:ferritin-like protein